MRVEPRLGEKVWFRPRGAMFGWGWEPASWEGWVVSVGFVIVAIGGGAFGPTVAVAAVIGAGLVLLTLCLLKGTAPGGRRRLEEYERAVRPRRGSPDARPADPLIEDVAARLSRKNLQKR